MAKNKGAGGKKVEKKIRKVQAAAKKVTDKANKSCKGYACKAHQEKKDIKKIEKGKGGSSKSKKSRSSSRRSGRSSSRRSGKYGSYPNKRSLLAAKKIQDTKIELKHRAMQKKMSKAHSYLLKSKKAATARLAKAKQEAAHCKVMQKCRQNRH